MKYCNYFFFLTLLFSLMFSSCNKEELLTDSSAKLEFSTDSVLFDTVFTTLGSTTRIFRIYNKHSQTMNISRIYLATGSTSPFKMNVDGISGKSITDVEIGGGDSLFVFVQVTVDPTGVNNPLLIRDSIIFEINNNIQNVNLTAIGQDVYMHKPDHFPTNGFPPYSIIDCAGGVGTWMNDKPHLIFGYAVVDSACTLNMMQGTRVYLYNGAVLWVYKDATLNITGTKGSEVTFQGMRLEPDYRELPGQWGMIWLSAGSKNNSIEYAIIKNGGIGLRVDTVVTPGVPTLKLHNTIIRNMTAAAVYGLGSRIESSNCVFSNCGQYVAALTIGGDYSFEHCTFANYWTGDRTTPLLLMNNYYISGSFIIPRPLDNCLFRNCIFDGNLAEEIGIDSITGLPAGSFAFNYKFDHCLLRTTRAVSGGSTAPFYVNCDRNLPVGFRNTAVSDYTLKSDATNVIDKGTGSFSALFDLKGNLRPNGSAPDLGAYEYYP
jgi:hypothetical protein